MRRVWLLAALAAASLHCGREDDAPPDPNVQDVDLDGVVRAQDCNDADGSRWQRLPGHRDADGDGVAGTTVTQVCAGAALPSGWFEAGSDCDDADPARWRLSQAYLDADGDGHGAEPAGENCRGDALPPGWVDAADDCDPLNTYAWAELPYTYRDADHDGATVASFGVVCSGTALPWGYGTEPLGDDCDDASAAVFARTDAFVDADRDGRGGAAGTVCAGVSLPAGWSALGGDCDDANPVAYELTSAYRDADGDGRGAELDAVCAAGPWGTLPAGWTSTPGDCDDADRYRLQLLSYYYVDRDGDGHTPWEYGTICAGTYLPSPYLSSPGGRGTADCDDADAAVWLAMSGYVDADEDGAGEGATVALCTTGSLPSGYLASAGDCAVGDATRWRAYAYTLRDADGDGRYVSESGSVCYGLAFPAGYAGTSSLPPDCDDADRDAYVSVVGYVDADRDEVGAGPPETFCTAGALPADRVAAGTDCAAEDASRWQTLAYAGSDADGDGYTTRVGGSVCAGTALPAPYRATIAGNDCEDTTTSLWRWVVLYPDADGDGVGAPPREITCLGEAIPAGYSEQGWDSNDLDPGVQVLAGEEDPLAAIEP